VDCRWDAYSEQKEKEFMTAKKPTQNDSEAEPYAFVAYVTTWMSRIPERFRKAAAWAFLAFSFLVLAITAAVAATIIMAPGGNFLGVFLSMLALAQGITAAILTGAAIFEFQEALNGPAKG
jgi:hypothetical protein